ncbi:MAG: penicillin-insensitive murein endopeptidase [Thermoleophilaceae bacterium]
MTSGLAAVLASLSLALTGLAEREAAHAQVRPTPPPATDVPGPGRRGEFGGAPIALPTKAPVAVGKPNDGRLMRGIRVPDEGPLFFTWDPVRERSPNRSWRRYGSARLLATVDAVLKEYHRRNPNAPRVAIGDLSRSRGGGFGRRFGGLGHASHQNGLDVDIYYPRKDRREREPTRVSQIDLRLAQDLVDLFVAEGARYVFVGPRTRLHGPPNVVQELVHHDDHLHVRVR